MVARWSMRWRVVVGLMASLFLANDAVVGSADEKENEAKSKPRSASPVEIKVEPRKLGPGGALSARTLVTRPIAIPDVIGWTIESKRHRGYLIAAALSPDAKQVATGGLDGIIRLWDAETGAFQRAFVGHDSYIYDLAWSPDGRTLAAAGSFDAQAKLWDVRTGLLLQGVKFETWVSKVVWSPDGRMLLLCGGESGSAKFWDVSLAVERGKIDHGKHILSATWSPDGETVAFVVTGQAVQLFEMTPFKVRKSFGEPSAETAYSASWSSDSKQLAVATNLGTKIWDVESEKVTQTLAGPMTVAAWSPNGKVLATAYNGGAVQTWNTSNWMPLKPLPIAGTGLIWSPDDSRLCAFNSVNVQLWDATSEKALPPIDATGPGSRAMWTTGKIMASGVGTQAVSLWEIASGKLLRKLEGHTAGITAIAWAANDKTLATASADKTVRVWDTVKGEQLKKLEGHTDVVSALSWNPNSKQFASGSYDKTVRLWDVATGKSTKTLDKHPAAVTVMDWNGKMLLAGGPTNMVSVWNTTTGQQVRKVEVSGAAQSLAWSPDGKVLAAGGVDETLRIFNPANGQVLASLALPGSPPSVTALAWSTKGETIASGRGNHTAQIWNLQTGKTIHSVATMAPVQEVMWSESNRTLAVGTSDRCVRFFDTATGKIRTTMISDADQVPAVSAEGHYRAVPDTDPELVYVVQTEKTQDTYSPAEFAKKFRWKNAPKEVRLGD